MMKLKKMVTILAIFCVFITGKAIAEDNPEVLVKTVAEATLMEVVGNETPEQLWQNFLRSKGWDSELSEGGVIIIPDRELIISSATVFTRVGIGQPGWVESRIAAYEQAEMEAKTKIIRYLAESVATSRSLSMMEHAVWNDDDVDKIKNLNEAEQILHRIANKSMALTEGTLDQALQKIDPDYDLAKYEGESLEDLQVITEDTFRRQIRSVAMKTLIGVTPLYSAESSVGGNEYQVLVGVIWSPKLNRLAMNLFNDEYNIPKVNPGKTVARQIPDNHILLLSTVGTRIVIDENGQYAVMAYAQAQPRRAGASRKEAALQQAGQVAANRARAMIVNFIREGMTLRESEGSQELSREFSDMTVGTETVRDYQKKIKGKKVKVKLTGLRVLKEWSDKHPATGQQVAGAVVAWTPASSKLSKSADQMMKSRPGDKENVQGGIMPGKSAETPSMESMEVDTSVY